MAEISDMGINEAEVQARAWFLGTRLDVRDPDRGETNALAPMTVRTLDGGHVFLFRYGVAVFVAVEATAEAAFLQSLRPLLTAPFEAPETETVAIALATGGG